MDKSDSIGVSLVTGINSSTSGNGVTINGSALIDVKGGEWQQTWAQFPFKLV